MSLREHRDATSLCPDFRGFPAATTALRSTSQGCRESRSKRIKLKVTSHQIYCLATPTHNQVVQGVVLLEAFCEVQRSFVVNTVERNVQVGERRVLFEDFLQEEGA